MRCICNSINKRSNIIIRRIVVILVSDKGRVLAIGVMTLGSYFRSESQQTLAPAATHCWLVCRSWPCMRTSSAVLIRRLYRSTDGTPSLAVNTNPASPQTRSNSGDHAQSAPSTTANQVSHQPHPLRKADRLVNFGHYDWLSAPTPRKNSLFFLQEFRSTVRAVAEEFFSLLPQNEVPEDREPTSIRVRGRLSHNPGAPSDLRSN